MTPNWYASVMGTGIVATAAVTLPVHVPGLHAFATAVWLLAATLLIGLTVAAVRRPRAYFTDPVMAHFYGAPPMAMLTVGAGTLLLGRDLIGLPAALAIDAVLWTAGTAAGLFTAVAVPYLQFTRHEGNDERSAFGGWLLPVVPPMVSAATGALLVPHVPAGQARLALLLACYAMFGLSLIASFVIITLIWGRLAVHRAGPARLVPTLWIVLGPIGQSITAANLLGGVAGLALPGPYAGAMKAFGVLYGVPAWGFALLWMALATAVTIRAARDHLPFTPAWWSFTFPVGTVVTGTSALALHTDSVVFRSFAVVLYAALVAAWATVGIRTLHHANSTGRPKFTGRTATVTQPPAEPQPNTVVRPRYVATTAHPIHRSNNARQTTTARRLTTARQSDTVGQPNSATTTAQAVPTPNIAGQANKARQLTVVRKANVVMRRRTSP